MRPLVSKSSSIYPVLKIHPNQNHCVYLQDFISPIVTPGELKCQNLIFFQLNNWVSGLQIKKSCWNGRFFIRIVWLIELSDFKFPRFLRVWKPVKTFGLKFIHCNSCSVIIQPIYQKLWSFFSGLSLYF